jgi:NhaP-type Na+/H+ or K+/H+ antiporter
MVCYVRYIRSVAFCIILLVSESDTRNSCVSYFCGWMVGCLVNCLICWLVGWLVELVGDRCVIYFLGLLVDRLVS